MESIFSDLSPLQREQAIEDNAYTKEEVQHKRYYSDDELDEFRAYYCGLLIDVELVESELSELSLPLKERIKKIKADAKEHFDKVRKKYEVVEINAYGMDDQDRGVMNYYDIQGNFLHSRKLTPDERQYKLRAYRTGTDE
jgi:hypothetical protein